MTYYHANGCGGHLRLSRRGPSPETSTWYCPDCGGYTNAIAEDRDAASRGRRRRVRCPLMTLNKTNIGWTDFTYNYYHGCAKTSEGCRWCYAENLSLAQEWTPEDWTIVNLDDNFMFRPKEFGELEKLPGARWVWAPSMSDPFVPSAGVELLTTIAIGQMHHYKGCCFQTLTKWGPDRGITAPPMPRNVMLGVTVETQRRDYRLDWLREQEAGMKFVSFEPLLESVDPDLTGIDWAIVGGESGENRREFDPQWARDLYWSCQEQDTAYFFKQHGDLRPEQRTTIEIDGVEREYREFPETPGGVVDAPQEFLFEQTTLGEVV